MRKLLLFLICMVALPLYAKDNSTTEKTPYTENGYINQLGIVAGSNNGISYRGYLTEKHFAFFTDAAYDLHNKSLNLLTNFMYKGSVYSNNSSMLNLYAGGGVQLGATLEYLRNSGASASMSVSNPVNLCMGLNAIIGIEWCFKNAPISLSLDYRPGTKTMNVNDAINTTKVAYSDLQIGFHWNF